MVGVILILSVDKEAHLTGGGPVPRKPNASALGILFGDGRREEQGVKNRTTCCVADRRLVVTGREIYLGRRVYIAGDRHSGARTSNPRVLGNKAWIRPIGAATRICVETKCHATAADGDGAVG